MALLIGPFRVGKSLWLVRLVQVRLVRAFLVLFQHFVWSVYFPEGVRLYCLQKVRPWAPKQKKGRFYHFIRLIDRNYLGSIFKPISRLCCLFYLFF